MSTHTLSIAYVGAAELIDPYWILIEQDTADESATVSDAASLLDALFDLDPCIESDTDTDTGSLSIINGLPTTNLATAIDETLDLSFCDAEADGSVEVEIAIFRSHLDEPYTLRIQGGSVIETVQTGGIVTATMEITAEVTMQRPVVSGFSCTPAPTKRVGNTLSFSGDQVGHVLVATYFSQWDTITVKVDGINGEPGECTALAFHHGMVAGHRLDVPSATEADNSLCPSISWRPADEHQDVTCYKDIVVIKKCQCSDDELERYTYQQTVPCPDRDIKCPGVLTECMHLLGTEAVVERVECASDNQIGGGSLFTHKVSDPDYYKETCCQDPPFALPACPERRTTYQGDQRIQYGEAYWRDIYGQNARLVPVPPPGGVCGEWIIRQQITPQQCCDEVAPLVWDTSISPEVMAPSSAASVAVTGGILPLTWSVVGTGFIFQASGSTELITTSREVNLSALTSACGTAIITVTDGCTTVVGGVRSTAGAWVLVYSGAGGYHGAPPVIAPGTADRPSFTDHWREGVVGGVKVRQKFSVGCHCYAQCYAVRKLYTDAINYCHTNTSLSACATLIDWDSKGYFSGSLFDDTHRCEECGGCMSEMPNYSYFSYSLGAHSQIYWDSDSNAYKTDVGHTAITNTEVYKWRC